MCENIVLNIVNKVFALLGFIQRHFKFYLFSIKGELYQT